MIGEGAVRRLRVTAAGVLGVVILVAGVSLLLGGRPAVASGHCQYSPYTPYGEPCPKLTPTLETAPEPASAQLGQELNDRATLSNGGGPTGTLTFSLYRPSDTTCSNPVYTSQVNVNGNGDYYSYNYQWGSQTGSNIADEVGTWHWTVAYSGDENNFPVSSGCADEPVDVIEAPGPSNDDFASPMVIASLPFSDTADITDATTEPGEPIDAPYYQGRTVWYSFTPTENGVVRFGPGGSGGTPFLVIYRADSPGLSGLTRIAGDNWSSATDHVLNVEADATYYVQGGDRYAVWGFTSSFSLTVDVVTLSNDDFADAIPFDNDDLPFSGTGELTAATLEPDEPVSCGGGYTQTMWYAFTPSTTGSYGAFGVSSVAVYTGTSLATLTNVACADWPGLYFHADAGTTYYLQVYGGGVSVDVVPPPEADFQYSPGDPSVIDEVSFSYWIGGYWDSTVTGYSWDLGDGTTGTGSPVSHRYARDGDYTVTMTVEARGGRTNSTTKTVAVRTHDVTLLSLVAPKKGMVGKQRKITVGIGNTRYPETVQVDLYKVTPQGDVLVETSIQAVRPMKLKQTVTFTFNYVFTSDDATIGKLPFKAVATIQGARDAASSDNVATSPPTLVTK